MKTILKISAVGNVILLGGMLVLWRHPRVVTVSAPTATATEVAPQAPSATVVQAVPAPLRWSQFLSSGNYLTFVANLRAAGCPEATVKDIVRGNTARAYAAMRERMGVNATEPGRWSEQAQAQMTAYFLGQVPTAEVTASATTGQAERQNIQAMDDTQRGNATLAEFLQAVDLTTPGMSAEQVQQTANVRQTFLAQINAAGQAASSQANTSSTGGGGNTALTQTGTGNSPTYAGSSQAGMDNSQASTDSSQTTQSQAGNSRFERSAETQALIQEAQQQSIMAGLFGMGAGVQYDQYQSAQGQ